MLLCLKTETELAFKMLYFFKKLDDGEEKKTVSVNFSHALFSLLSTHDNLVMTQALVWVCMVWFRAIQVGASCVN